MKIGKLVPLARPRLRAPLLAGAAPPDRFTSAPDVQRLGSMVLSRGPASALRHFFGAEADTVERIDRTEGGWKLVARWPQGIASGSRERVLPNDVPAGWSSAWGESYYPPFGCFTRRQDGWEASCVRADTDPRGSLESSLLSLHLPDQGPPRMVLWERLRDGGSMFYRLDAEAWLRQPGQPPAVLEWFPTEPGAPARAPFYEPRAAEEPPLYSQFFGPNSPNVKLEPFTPSEFVPGGGAAVNLKFTWGGIREVSFCLHRSAEPGWVHASYRMEDQLFQHWQRTADGWMEETHGRLLPEHFATLKDVVLRSELEEDGRVRSMVLRACGHDGAITEYLLDTAAIGNGSQARPAVLQIRHTAAPPKPPPPPPSPTPAIEDGGEWLIIDGVRVGKNTRNRNAGNETA